MSDYSLPPCLTLVSAASGYGKTTFAFKYLANVLHEQEHNPSPAACIFIFDWKLEAQRRLGIPAVGTVAQCEAALATRCVVFNPHIMFPGDRLVLNPEGEKVLNDEKMALRWFCKWVFEVCQRGPGKKVLFIDELNNFQSRYQLYPEIARIARTGRAEHLELLLTTHLPREYHADLRGLVTEWVCFNMAAEKELDAVREYFAGVDAVKDLPKGHFLAYHRETRTELRWRVF